MRRYTLIAWIFLLASAGLVPLALAEVTYTETREGDNDITVIRMTVTPAAEPVPAMRHRLMARDIDVKAGNAAPFYYRALMEVPWRMEALRKKYDEEEEVGKWYIAGRPESVTIEQLPLEKVRDAVDMAWIGREEAIGNQLAEAISQRDCDWQLNVEEVRGVEIVQFRLPEFQLSRDLARLVTMRARLEIAEKRYDDAIVTLRLSNRLGRDVAKVPFLVCGLIGIAIEGITNATISELIAAPDSPNLYWALTELPQPLVDLGPAARFEMDFGPRMFPFIHDAESADHTQQEWNRLFVKGVRDLSLAGAPPWPHHLNDVGAGIAATGAALVGYTHAKARLIEQGLDPDRVEAMAVGQVMAIYTDRNYRRLADDWEKLWYVPFSELGRFRQASVRQMDDAGVMSGGEDREVFPLVTLLLPAMEAARSTQVRLERDVAALRVIEALRMYAAAHDGRLPRILDEIDQVPVPLNPMTGKAFAYRLDGAIAVLELPASDGTRGYHRRYEIQIAE